MLYYIANYASNAIDAYTRHSVTAEITSGVESVNHPKFGNYFIVLTKKKKKTCMISIIKDFSKCLMVEIVC